jgi:uncharacterized protein (DUF58 family)
MAKSFELLPHDLLAQLEQLQLVTRRRLAGRFAGEHRSPNFGSSLDFADYREYHPGDDYRRIDYPVYARTGQLFLRLFEAEDDVTIRILLDRSASMGFHGKLQQAIRLAAATGFVALTRRDPVTLHLEPATAPAQRFSGRDAVSPLFRALSAVTAAGSTDLDRVTGDLLGVPGPRGVTVVISDLLTPSWDAALDRLAGAGGDTVVLHVLAEAEVHPDLTGDLDVVDAETGEQVAVSMAVDARHDYEALVEQWLTRCAARCTSRGATYQRVLASDDVGEVLLRGWRERGVVR